MHLRNSLHDLTRFSRDRRSRSFFSAFDRTLAPSHPHPPHNYNTSITPYPKYISSFFAPFTQHARVLPPLGIAGPTLVREFLRYNTRRMDIWTVEAFVRRVSIGSIMIRKVKGKMFQRQFSFVSSHVPRMSSRTSLDRDSWPAEACSGHPAPLQLPAAYRLNALTLTPVVSTNRVDRTRTLAVELRNRASETFRN